MGESTAADAGLPTDKKEGEPLDKVLAHLDSINKRMDAMCGRMDAFEKKEPPKEEKKEESKGEDKKEEKDEKEEGEPTPLAADKTKKDAAKADGEEQPGGKKEAAALKEEREENDLDKNDSARADAAAIRARLDGLEKRMPHELPEEDRLRFVEAQAKAERVAQAFGDSAGAPRHLNGESLSQYRRRLLGAFKKHSRSWKDVDLTPFADKALDTVESQVYSDALAAAMSPQNVEAGTLRIVTATDDTGRRIRKFYGDPEACWGPFKQPSRLVTGWQTKFQPSR